MKKIICLTEQDISNIIDEVINNIKLPLDESLSSILYHFTTLKNLINIVKTDKLLLSSAFDSVGDSKLNANRNWYMSFTREKHSQRGYVGNRLSSHAPLSERYGVRLYFDGNELNQKYKGGPVNYHSQQLGPHNKQLKSTKGVINVPIPKGTLVKPEDGKPNIKIYRKYYNDELVKVVGKKGFIVDKPGYYKKQDDVNKQIEIRQSEDRLFSNNGIIDNALELIKGLIFYF